MTIFYKTKENLNNAQIESIEKYANLKFPSEYKIHLLKHNGGKCNPNVFQFIEDGELTESCLDTFLAIYGGQVDSLKQDVDTYKIDEKRLPLHILPIANDSGGNLICVSCSGDDNGSIYFWDHENEVDYSTNSDSDYSNLFKVANSFNEFIDNLKEDLSL